MKVSLRTSNGFLSSLILIPMLASAQPPQKSLSLSGPTQMTAGDCSPLVISASYAGQKADNAESGVNVVIVSLSTQGSGSFFADRACSSPVSSVLIAAADKTASAYFRDTRAENVVLMASDTRSQFTRANLALTVNPGPPGLLAFVAQPEQFATACGINLTSSPAVQVRDAFGNPTAATPVTLSAFRDPQCLTPAEGTLISQSSIAGDTVTFSNLSYSAFHGSAIYLGASVAGAPVACSRAVTLVGLSSAISSNTCIMSGTLEPASGATLDCQGRVLAPTVVGTGNPSPTTLAPPSVPETAIFLHGVQGATIQNCDLQGFDHGLILFGSDGNRILSNRLSVRGLGVYMMSANHNQISGNSITWSATTGKGVQLDSLTNSNTVAFNTLIENGSSGAVNLRLGAASFPGATIVKDAGIFVSGSWLGVATAYSNGTLYQINAIADPRMYTTQSSTNNVLSGNVVLGSIRVSGGSRNAVVSGNTVRSTTTGLIETSATGVSQRLPGQCSLDTSRLCFADSDCSIQGFDAVSQGFCPVSTSLVTVVGGSWNNEFTGNSIVGPMSTGISSVGHFSVIRSNRIVGGAIGTGIAWAGSKTIEHNQVSATVAMALEINANAGPYDPSLTSVSLNDFTGYATAVNMPAGWTVTPTLFSSGGMGNYWGLSCASSGGFDQSTVSGSPAGILVTDDHPFGVSVAGAPLGQLPAACR